MRSTIFSSAISGLILLLGVNCGSNRTAMHRTGLTITKYYGIQGKFIIDTPIMVDSLTYLHFEIEISDSVRDEFMQNRANYEEEIVIIYNGVRREFTLEEFVKLLGFRDPKYF